MTGPTPAGPLVLVDWENLRAAANRAGRFPPGDKLLAALRDAVVSLELWPGSEPTYRLYMRRSFESLATKSALTAGGAEIPSLWEGGSDKNVADVEMILGAVEMFYEDPAERCLVVVSDDGDLARAVTFFHERYEASGGEASAVLLSYSSVRVPRNAVLRNETVGSQLSGALGTGVDGRPWLDGTDTVAWQLRWLSTKYGFGKNVHPGASSHGESAKEPLLRIGRVKRATMATLETVEPLDAALVRLQNLAQDGPPLFNAAERALAEAGVPAPRKALESLIRAGMVTVPDPARVRVEPEWAMGLLVPAYRLILKYSSAPIDYGNVVTALGNWWLQGNNERPWSHRQASKVAKDLAWKLEKLFLDRLGALQVQTSRGRDRQWIFRQDHVVVEAVRRIASTATAKDWSAGPTISDEQIRVQMAAGGLPLGLTPERALAVLENIVLVRQTLKGEGLGWRRMSGR